MPVTLPVNPTAPLATAAELAAQAARIDQLWAKVFGTGPTPSPTGSFIQHATDAPLIDDALNAWSLVASAANGLQIAVQGHGAAPPPVVDPVTANLASLAIAVVAANANKRTIVQRNAAGACYWTAAPGSQWVQYAGPVPP